MSTAPVPMSHPATAMKNSDGTYTVRVQHTIEGQVTEVHFGNVVFAEALANAYAAMLNGSAVLDAKIGKATADIKAAIPDAKADAKKALAEAEKKASEIVTAAKLEVRKLRAEGATIIEETKVEAEKLLTEARTEAAKILREAATKVEPPAVPVKPTVEDE